MPLQKEMQDFKKQIESHSTMITNERIGEIKNIVWKKAMQTLAGPPDALGAMEFFNAVFVWWAEIPGIMSQGINTMANGEVEAALQRGNKLCGSLRITGNLSPVHIEELIQLSFKIQFLINQSMQNLGYFFKISQKDPVGIKESLAIFENLRQKDGKRQIQAASN